VSDTYPIDMVRGDAHRQAFNEPDVIRLRYEGYRRADEQPVERGGFLPPPRPVASQPAAAEDAGAKTNRRKTS